MGFVLEQADGGIPAVHRVWSARCEGATAFSSAAKVSSMIAFARAGDRTTVHLRGPETKSTRLTCEDGWEFFGVELRLGVSLSLFPPSGLADLADVLLPVLPNGRILLGGRDWEMPTPQNVDVLVERLLRAGLLTVDPLVGAIRRGERPRAMSERSAQIRFRRAVGVSRRTLLSIERARRAAALLATGVPIAEAVAAGGYYDQAQLTRAMRWATGHTPGELRADPFIGF